MKLIKRDANAAQTLIAATFRKFRYITSMAFWNITNDGYWGYDNENWRARYPHRDINQTLKLQVRRLRTFSALNQYNTKR